MVCARMNQEIIGGQLKHGKNVGQGIWERKFCVDLVSEITFIQQSSVHYIIPLIFYLSDGNEFEDKFKSEVGGRLGTNKYTSCYTHFVTDDGACKDELGDGWAATDTWETCGLLLGKKVLCRRGK